MKAGGKHGQAERQALTSWLAEVLPGATGVAIDRVDMAREAGSSAETLFMDARWNEAERAVARRFVLRRQIVGHDLLPQPELSFQARIMQQLSKRPEARPRVPGVLALEPSGTVLGTPFLVMECLPGRIIAQNPNYNLAGWLYERDLEGRRQVWSNGLRALAVVHRIDWREGLEFVARGRPPSLAGYVDWVCGWVRWAVRGRPYPVGDAAMKYLSEQMPQDAPTELLWGDATPANMLFDDAGEVTGLIDWELAALAPGEIDLAWWLMFDDLFSAGFGVPRLEGLPSREESIAIYGAAAGRDVRHLHYYEVLVRLRMAMIALRIADRKVAMGLMPPDNDAWLRNPFTAALSTMLDLDPVTTGADFMTVAGTKS
jgi:aminoglycoside phosphotransferase (APT) family kinase protein